MSGPRGEGRLVLASGAEVHVLFTNRALAEAETITGKPIMLLVKATSENAAALGDVLKLLAVGMEYARRDAGGEGARLTIKDAQVVMDEVGFLSCLLLVMQSLAAALFYKADEAAAPPDPR